MTENRFQEPLQGFAAPPYSMSSELADHLRMEDHDIIPTCLSADRHKPQDFLLHYLGCEQYFQREDYLMSLSDEQTKQVEAKLRRVQYLRSALSIDTEGCRMVQSLTASFRRWRATIVFQEGINRVRELRTMYFALNGNAQREAQAPTRQLEAEYDPDVDTNAYVIRFKDGNPVRDIDDPRSHEQFPCHAIPVCDLIDGGKTDCPLRPPKDTINYIHFPANNMFVSDKLQQ